ncbi:MAG: thrombospondin type 3 repeat-containing protein [Phycisphaerae bacterium]|nr:thrombospondin type 3 repeat-containing protein [Phycisphaerae bacterium]
MTASFCNPGTTHPDTTMSVFCNNCAQLTCVGGNDQGGGTCGNDSQFTWCSQAGTTYYITVGGWLSSTGTGPVELLVTEGASCSTPPNCSPAYCASGATSSADSLCGKVALNGYVNDTTGTCATYSDFTGASVTTLNQGSMYSVDVTVDTCGGCYGKWAKVFIDWNQDLDFTDAGEQVYTSGATSSSCPQTFSGSFTVPAGATLGDTRMRVVVRESGSESSTTSCGTFTWGETEDYTITVGPSSPVVQGPWDDDDGDEVPNFCDNCPNDANAGQEDADGDGNGDPCDICPGFDDFADADGDTVPDGCDACPGFDDFADADGDTVADGCDNCPNIPNTNQADGDGDGVGNVCDNCPNTANPTQVDSDGDGNGNACDLCPGFDDYDDADGDGVPGNGTGCDQCPDKPDGAEGALGDDDGDGVLNCNDQCIGVDDAVFAPGCVGQIPAASEWGLAVLALLLLVGGKLYFGRREAALS